MLKPGMFLASIDIKDAFYSVLIFPGHRKYLRFIWKENIYQFLAMPNGYIDAIRIVNKLLKPVFASLHWGRGLGFVIHPSKSIFVPTQKITFLGFEIDT